jgi:hypothetical protein
MAAAVIATACMTGPSAHGFDPVKTGGGAQLKIKLNNKERADGELIETRDSAIVVMHMCGLQVLPYASIDKLVVRGYDARYGGGGHPGPGLREELRLLSRFPTGIPDSLRATLGRCSSSRSTTTPEVSEATYLANARHVAIRYASLDTAIAAGYRRIGGDVPSLGEHWVNPGMVMLGRVDPETPSVLIYVRTPAGPRMAGVAWTTVLRPGEPYPDSPVGRAAWHEHNGTVAEETLPMHHHGAMASNDPTRIAILHAWVGIENPAGVWVADNWALPYIRAGLRPENVTPVMGRALSLAAPGATSYYVRVVEKAVGDDAQALDRTRAQIDSAAREIIAVTSTASQELTAGQRARVEGTWTSLWERLGQDVQLREVSVAMR